MSNYPDEAEKVRQPLGYDPPNCRDEADSFMQAFGELSERNHSNTF